MLYHWRPPQPRTFEFRMIGNNNKIETRFCKVGAKVAQVDVRS
jgi:hypothetical protein